MWNILGWIRNFKCYENVFVLWVEWNKPTDFTHCRLYCCYIFFSIYNTHVISTYIIYYYFVDLWTIDVNILVSIKHYKSYKKYLLFFNNL